MTLMTIRLELGRTREFPEGDPRYGYEFVAPIDPNNHIDAARWAKARERCTVRHFRPGQHDRYGVLRHVGHGWRFDYEEGSEDDEPFFRLDKHVLAPGLYVTVTGDDGEGRPFKIVKIAPLKAAA